MCTFARKSPRKERRSRIRSCREKKDIVIVGERTGGKKRYPLRNHGGKLPTHQRNWKIKVRVEGGGGKTQEVSSGKNRLKKVTLWEDAPKLSVGKRPMG